MGGKPRKQPINGTRIFASRVINDPVGILVQPTDKELFAELAIRGYDLSYYYGKYPLEES